MLGTFVTVTVYAPTRAEGISVISAAFDEFRRVDALMSIHRPDSELSGLNARAAAEPVPVSADLFRVIAKAQEGAPHETLLVLDANTGQNALAQVAAFDAALGLTGLVLTKLDGSAKGGVVAAIAGTRPAVDVGPPGVDDLGDYGGDFLRALRIRELAGIGPAATRIEAEIRPYHTGGYQ